MFIPFPGKPEKGIVSFYQPEEDHAAHKNGHPLPGGNILPELHEYLHGGTSFVPVIYAKKSVRKWGRRCLKSMLNRLIH
jgi:hypothetical protein